MTPETVGFDTSGAVNLRGLTDHAYRNFWTWEDLPNDFVRGYIRAAFESLPERWVCDECGNRGTHEDGSNQRAWCDYCQDDFPSAADLCPGCGRDSLRSACPKCAGRWSADDPQPAFSDLHPNTLASMLADCERDMAVGRRLNLAGNTEDRTSARAGRKFWRERQTGNLFDAPPLRLSLDPNGKVIAEHG